MQDDDLARYARHSRWTEPGSLGAALDPLPANPACLPEIVGGLMLHPLFTALGGTAAEPSQRTTAQIIGTIVGKDPRPLSQARAPGKRVLGTCRNHALLACAILRQHGAPARLRVGFADYFTVDFREDHWLCEYHDGRAYRLLDAELTAETCRRFGVAFDPADVPRDRFLAAGPAWQKLRRGEDDPARFGVSASGLMGMWFAAGSLLRDLAALAMEEMMPWDYWGPAREFRPGVDIPREWLDRLDSLADALAPAPVSFRDARAIVAAHPWAALTPTVVSFPEGKPVEVALRRPGL